MMSQILLVAHVLGDVLFFGGIIIGTIWMKQAAGVGEAKVAQFALASMRRMNRWTLHLGAALILISGFWMALSAPIPLKPSANPWLLYSVILFFVVLFLAMGAQSPIARKMLQLAESNPPDFAATFAKIAARWNLLSVINILLLIGVLVLMIYQPGGAK